MDEIKEGYIIDYISGLQVKETPEEVEAVQPFSKILVDDYGYPKSHVHTRPQYRVKIRPSDKKKEYPVDIAVFSSETHKEEDVYIIVECKKKNRKDGRSQLEDYLRSKMLYCGGLIKIRALKKEIVDEYLLLGLLNSYIVKRQIRTKQFTRDVIDTLGQRLKEVIIPIPNSEELKKVISEKVHTIVHNRIQARDIIQALSDRIVL